MLWIIKIDLMFLGTQWKCPCVQSKSLLRQTFLSSAQHHMVLMSHTSHPPRFFFMNYYYLWILSTIFRFEDVSDLSHSILKCRRSSISCIAGVFFSKKKSVDEILLSLVRDSGYATGYRLKRETKNSVTHSCSSFIVMTALLLLLQKEYHPFWH